MGKNNLQVVNTGLDSCYLNGIPIVEAEIDMSDVYKKVARISSLAVQADPYFNGHTNAQKLFSESHGEGDRITADFLEEGARDILPVFIPFQRLIPEGVFDVIYTEFEYLNNAGDSSWTNPSPDSVYSDSIKIVSTQGTGDVTFVVDGVTLGTVSLPDQIVEVTNYLSYDLAGYLGGYIATVANYDHSENARNNNIAQKIELIITNASSDFEYNYKICASKYDAIGWAKALSSLDDVKLPAIGDSIRVGYLINDFTWNNTAKVRVSGITVKHNSGSADVKIIYNDQESIVRNLSNNTVGEDLFDYYENVSFVSVELTNKSDDFSYDLIVNTLVPKTLPSPRFEFDSLWNPGKVIFRYQNMDTRINKLDYTSNTLRDTRVDPNIFDEVLKYLKDALKNYVLKELYLAIGYDKKAAYYNSAYENNRRSVKYWVRSEKGLQTQSQYGG